MERVATIIDRLTAPRGGQGRAACDGCRRMLPVLALRYRYRQGDVVLRVCVECFYS